MFFYLTLHATLHIPIVRFVYIHILISPGIGIPEPEQYFCSNYPDISHVSSQIYHSNVHIWPFAYLAYLSPQCVTVINTRYDLCTDTYLQQAAPPSYKLVYNSINYRYMYHKPLNSPQLQSNLAVVQGDPPCTSGL